MAVVSNKVSSATFSKVVALENTFARLASLAGFTEAASGSGYNYTLSGGSTGLAKVSNKKLPSLADGYIQAKLTAHGGGYPFLCAAGSNNIATAPAWESTIVGCFVGPGGNYQVTQGNYAAAPNTPRNFAAGDVIRLARESGVWKVYISSDDGATFTLIHTFAGTDYSEAFPLLMGGDTGAGTFAFQQVKISGLAMPA